MMTTVDGFPIQVCDTGPEKGSVVVLLCAAERALTAYEAVCERLHTASLRTIVVGPDPRLTPKSVVGILDVLDVSWGVLVGDRDGAVHRPGSQRPRPPAARRPRRRDSRRPLPPGRDQHNRAGQQLRRARR